MHAEKNFRIPLFNFGLFNDAASSIECTAQKDAMVAYDRMEMYGERR